MFEFDFQSAIEKESSNSSKVIETKMKEFDDQNKASPSANYLAFMVRASRENSLAILADVLTEYHQKLSNYLQDKGI